MASFSIQVGEFASKTKGKFDTIVRKIMIDISARLVERSPVDTGRFRANWQYGTLQTYPTGTLDALDPTGADTLARIARRVNAEYGAQVHLFINNLPYAVPLENGWSKQAPYGMVGLTALEFEAMVDTAAEEVRDQ